MIVLQAWYNSLVNFSVQIPGFSLIKSLNSLIIELQCNVSSLTDQVTIWPIPFILLCLGKFNKIAKLANNCKPSVKALNTAIVLAISWLDFTSKPCM